ncbi:serine protease inhibitor Kazal-type 1-like [Polypterus senegalus]|uniref:serine protease inhibitor Kazal-type 1-like n=1 Tax=Polypterus senegalus TaxID=55291 RepID=UPI001966B096|nr:serine protease inhibitor Kazal-type 1-like [Polypterus senegalus]
MSATRLLLLCVAFICLSVLSDGAAVPPFLEQPDCHKYENNICLLHWAPVCGKNGQTYINECTLCMYIKKKKTPIFITKRDVC